MLERASESKSVSQVLRIYSISSEQRAVVSSFKNKLRLISNIKFKIHFLFLNFRLATNSLRKPLQYYQCILFFLIQKCTFQWTKEPNCKVACHWSRWSRVGTFVHWPVHGLEHQRTSYLFSLPIIYGFPCYINIYRLQFQYEWLIELHWYLIHLFKMECVYDFYISALFKMYYSNDRCFCKKSSVLIQSEEVGMYLMKKYIFVWSHWNDVIGKIFWVGPLAWLVY